MGEGELVSAPVSVSETGGYVTTDSSTSRCSESVCCVVTKISSLSNTDRSAVARLRECSTEDGLESLPTLSSGKCLSLRYMYVLIRSGLDCLRRFLQICCTPLSNGGTMV